MADARWCIHEVGDHCIDCSPLCPHSRTFGEADQNEQKGEVSE